MLILVYYLAAMAAALHQESDLTRRVFYGILPITGIELLLLPGDLALIGGILGVVFLVFLGPVTNACMYYATAFSPLCSAGRRFAAYLGVAALTAVPRIVTYFTIWGGRKEKTLYLAQLPIHLLSSWLYQKTNTIWAPILTHAIVNVISCAALYALRYFGYIS